MTIKDIMTSQIECVENDATIKQVADRMRSLNVGAIPVRQDEKIIGIVTDRDITIRATAEGLNPNEIKIEDVMTSDINWCFDDNDVDKISEMMGERQIRRLLVKNRDDEYIGILSLGDLSTGSNAQLAGETIKDVSQPSRPNR